VWTPKRVLLLLAGFAFFIAAYQVYSNVLGLGGIDGLTPLPEAFAPPTVEGAPIELPAPRVNMAERKIKQAFGEGSEELRRYILLDIPNRRMVLAVDDYKILPEPDNDKVELTPFSMAIFSNTPEGLFPEINTIRCNKAILRLDGPIQNQAEIGKHKIIGGVLQKNVQLTNNRGTRDRTDDLLMYTNGDVFYEEVRHHIWTEDPVRLIDQKSSPEPTTVTAVGMDVYLSADTGDPRKQPAAPKKAKDEKAKAERKSERMGDVERVELRSNVRMDLWSDSGFLSSGKQPEKPATAPAKGAKPSAPPTPAEKSKIVITTDGKFTYDLLTERATFEIPHRQSRHPEIVRVVREHPREAGKRDQLECERLDLQFHRKPAFQSKARTEDRTEGDLEIESAHGTGKDLTLTSDAEALLAFGDDLFYDAAKKQTILKGTPKMVAMKDGNEIQARELWIADSGEKDTPQQATAIGPGEVSLLDRTPEGRIERTIKARWQDKLIHQKEGTLDCLTLTGQACFEDPSHNQQLRADRLKVWMEPSKANAAPADEPRRLRPHHVEAKGRVRADSPDLHILEPTEYLVIWFQDVAKLPSSPSPSEPASPTREQSREPLAAGSVTGHIVDKPVVGKPDQKAPPPGGGKTPADKPKPPLTLAARSVEVHVLRSETKNELDRLRCEGAVHMHQDAETPADQPTDIQGDTLLLNQSPEGGEMTVYGKVAQVQFNKITIQGPDVNINQCTNQAKVQGMGAMQILTDTNFDGAKLQKPTQLTIYWKDAMEFDGKNARFRGGVQAQQQDSRLLAENMQVDFDRPISLKEGNKGGPPAKVDKLVCDKDVLVEEEVREGKKLQSYKRLKGPELNIDNTEKIVVTPGPGEVRIFQLGGDDPFLAPPAQPNKQPAGPPGKQQQAPKNAKEDYKITHVRFRDRMWANTRDPDKRIAIFYGDVEAVNVPSNNVNLQIDPSKLPPDGLFIQCEKLTVLTSRLPNGHLNQEMMAEGEKRSVQVKAREYYAIANIVKFDEASDRVIFEAVPGSSATIYRTLSQGGPQDRLTGKKIIYSRKTGDFRVEDSSGLWAN
jgi:lipopolysaccharide export system protein LptA